MWGQGLKREHKSWFLVKAWLEKSTARPVIERVEAHSGAVIERDSVTEHLRSSDNEVDVHLPTIHEELDSALKAYPDRSTIDVVLLSGCANDVGAQNLLNANATAEIDDMTEAKCGPPMLKLLRRVVVSFRGAKVIVTGYYPFFSERTKNDFVLRGLAKRLIKIIPGTRRLSSKEVLERLSLNSKQWYLASNKSLAEAVRQVNTENGSARPQVFFAKLQFDPNYSFAAPQDAPVELQSITIQNCWSCCRSVSSSCRQRMRFANKETGVVTSFLRNQKKVRKRVRRQKRKEQENSV